MAPPEIASCVAMSGAGYPLQVLALPIAIGSAAGFSLLSLAQIPFDLKNRNISRRLSAKKIPYCFQSGIPQINPNSKLRS